MVRSQPASRLHPRVRPAISLTTWVGGQIAGREPTADDVEPLTWALWERTRAQDTISYLGAQGRLESVARSLVTFFAPYDAVLTPALGDRPVAIGEIDGLGADPMVKYRKSARVHAVHRDRQRHRPARDRAAAVPGRGRAADRGAADRTAGARGGAARRSRRNSSGRCRGPVACRRWLRANGGGAERFPVAAVGRPPQPLPSRQQPRVGRREDVERRRIALGVRARHPGPSCARVVAHE